MHGVGGEAFHSGQHVAVRARGHVRDFSGFFARNPSKTYCIDDASNHQEKAAKVTG
jgi:hypothetical protein